MKLRAHEHDAIVANMEREYTAVFKKSGRWFLAWIEEISGVNTQGRTKKEARANLREALALILEERARLSMRKNGRTERENMVVRVRDLVAA